MNAILTEDYILKIEQEVIGIYTEFIFLLEEYLIPITNSAEDRVHYYTM